MSHTTNEPKVLLLHDGELSDVGALLRELGAGYADRQGEIAPADGAIAWRVVIASARRALELPWPLLRSSAFRIAILDGQSRTVRALLRRASFELLVRRPVHPIALRLLLLHALYRGPEKRRTPRVSVGAPVHFRTGLRRHRAILAEISEKGCRLLSSQRVATGQALTLLVPAALADGRAFSVKGLVVRVTPPKVGVAGVFTLAFDDAPAGVRARLGSLVSAHRLGPSALGGGEAAGAAAPAPRAKGHSAAPPTAAAERSSPRAPSAAPPASDATSSAEPAQAQPAQAAVTETERDEDLDFDLELDGDMDLDAQLDLELDPLEEPAGGHSPQRRRRAVIPLSDEASRVVLARGLSREGMRADPSPQLARCAEVSLALHLQTDGPPLRVRARVEPGQPGDGPWLRFEDLTPAELERLDALLAGLSVFAGGDGPEHALAVCEILEPQRG